MLKEVGFPERDILAALQLTRNNAQLAVGVWLRTWFSSGSHLPNPILLCPRLRAALFLSLSHLPNLILLCSRLRAALFLSLSHLPNPISSSALDCLQMEYLAEGRDVHALLEEQEDKILDVNSPPMRKILADARVQAALVEPRVLAGWCLGGLGMREVLWAQCSAPPPPKAMEDLLQDTNRVTAYLHDPIVGPALANLSQIVARMEITDADVDELFEDEDDEDDLGDEDLYLGLE